MAIKKKEFDYKAKFSTSTKYKEENFYYCGDAFLKACGLPGPIMGGLNMLLGHSNTGKTNALIMAGADAQKKGHLPVFIITEKKWSWKHAVQLGLQATQDETGEWVGDFIFNDGFKYIEQASEFINNILDEQEAGNIPRDIVFLWDSVGSIPCKMTYDGKGGKMANASVLQDTIGLGIASRIADSKKEDFPYYNTLCIVNQPWVEPADNPFGQPEIKAKGGTSIWLASSCVFLFGNQKKAGINHIDAVKGGRTVSYAIRTKISTVKNHINGLSFKDGKVIAVHNGFIDDTKEALDKYKKEYSEYWNKIMGGDGEMTLIEAPSSPYDELD